MCFLIESVQKLRKTMLQSDLFCKFSKKIRYFKICNIKNKILQSLKMDSVNLSLAEK